MCLWRDINSTFKAIYVKIIYAHNSMQIWQDTTKAFSQFQDNLSVWTKVCAQIALEVIHWKFTFFTTFFIYPQSLFNPSTLCEIFVYLITTYVPYMSERVKTRLLGQSEHQAPLVPTRAPDRLVRSGLVDLVRLLTRRKNTHAPLMRH